ncbi:MAG TPA: DNA methyltransferase [Planctomycetaceae bacterium]|nr:DNA methyltransferase [Planctomycetaceae bacterium]
MPRRNPDAATAVAPRRKPTRRCNALDGKRWLQNSISVWSDLRKTPEEQRLKHPAQFPVALVRRLIESFLPEESRTVFDPFCGSGSTLVAAHQMGHRGIGIELSEEYVALARSRLLAQAFDDGDLTLHHATADQAAELIAPQSVDLCVTSPPYWNILGQKRTADSKAIRHYGNLPGDLSLVETYDNYLAALTDVFAGVFPLLKPGAHCAIVVMDLRKQDRFYPLHSDLAARLQTVGYQLDDLIIWNRQTEYNNLRPLGYPAVFRVNKVHEFVVLMQKPQAKAAAGKPRR